MENLRELFRNQLLGNFINSTRNMYIIDMFHSDYNINFCFFVFSIFREDYNKVLSELSLICLQPLRSVYSDSSHDKKSRDIAAFAVRDKAIGRLKLSYPNLESYLFYDAFSHLSRTLIAEKAIHEEKRVDGRHLKDIRPIGCQVDLHDPLHGSALFQRGQTQVMCTVALDSLESALKSDTVSTLMG